MFDINALYEARSVAHAVELLQEYPEAVIIAGGSDILIKIRDGELSGCTLVSLQKLNELRGVSLDRDGTLRILPLTSFSHITKNPLIQKHVNVLGEAADTVGGPQIRNIGTIGGNICNGVTSADTASTLLAYDALVEYTGPGGVRILPISEHYVSAGNVALDPGEILTAILIPEESCKNCCGHYIKYSMRGAMDIATLGCSVNVRLTSDKLAIERVRIGFGVAGPVPLRAAGAETKGNGAPLCEDTVKSIAEAALADVNPRTSWRATREVRLHLVRELCERALRESITLAGGAII